MFYSFFDWLFASYLNGVPADDGAIGIFTLAGGLLAVAPVSVLMLALALGVRTFNPIYGFVVMLSTFVGLFVGLGVAVYPIQYNHQFNECSNIPVLINYNGDQITAVGVQCHNRKALTAEWGTWKFVGISSLVTKD